MSVTPAVLTMIMISEHRAGTLTTLEYLFVTYLYIVVHAFIDAQFSLFLHGSYLL